MKTLAVGTRVKLLNGVFRGRCGTVTHDYRDGYLIVDVEGGDKGVIEHHEKLKGLEMVKV